MGKPFLTIEEQVSLLESRGMKTDSRTARILAREGYYSIVNGYKGPFLDVAATAAAGDDRYREGATFADMYAVFSFDRDLRDLTFPYLIRAEATARTAIAYCFSERHREPDSYLLQDNYCQREEYWRPERYATEVSELTSKLRKRKDESRAEFIAHYRSAHDSVPLWVLANDLTFGNLEHLFNLMKPSERAAACKMVYQSTGRLGDGRSKFFDQKTARLALEALVRFRNKCAHDERLYCAAIGGRKNVGYRKMTWYLEYFLTEDEFNEFLKYLIALVSRRVEENKTVIPLLEPLGFFELGGDLNRRTRRLRQNS